MTEQTLPINTILMTLYADKQPIAKKLTFCVLYRDWLRFETTEIYQGLIEFLEACETPDTCDMRQELEDALAK